MSSANGVKDDSVRGPLNATRAATAVLDADGMVVGWSPTAEGLLGYVPQDVLGRPIDSLLMDHMEWGHPAPRATDVGRVARTLRMRHQDGRAVRVTTTELPLAHAGTGPARLLALADAEETEQWEALQSMLRGLATQSPVGLAIYGTDLRVVWTNAALYEEMGTSQYVGLGPDEMVTHAEVLSVEYPKTLEEMMRQVLATGEPVIDLHYRGRPPSDPERDHVWSCSYYRLQDSESASLGVCEETVDITDRYLAQQRLDLLVRAGAHLGTSLDIPRTARELFAVAVPDFADAVTVDLLEDVLEGEHSTPGARRAGTVVRVLGEAEGAAGAAGEMPVPGKRVHYAPDSPQARSLAADKPVQAGPPGPEGGDESPPQRSSLAVPLRVESATLGVVTFTRNRTPAPFDPAEQAVAEELAARVAVCIDNAHHYTREHAAALMLQRSLLPQKLPRLTGVELAHRYLPADSSAGVGGDWFDAIALSGARVGLVVGDVVGHGLRAAATMGRLRTSVRVLARLDLAPDDLLARLDDLLGEGADEQEAARMEGDEVPDDAALGVTCLYAVYDPVSGLCRMARAGHLLPAVVDPADGSVTFPDIPAGPPLGLGGLPFETGEMTLPEGSLLALFTDGLVLARDRDVEAGLEGLRAVLAEHANPLDELADRAVASLLSGPVDDDVALLLVRTRKLDSRQVATWELAPDPEEVARARAEAARQVHVWGLDDLVFTTELVVSELVTNALRYASGPIRLRLIRDRMLICEVSDNGHTSPHLRRAAYDDEGGRGLFLVAQMTQRWGTRHASSGKTIWAEQALP
ncbi:PAS domain S-box-containing protein [Streptomyces sp. SLBN-118]|uniref:SpoIIE family protein phosphatase n=1 Tax=Streptomyces sp. SLBN-118 TaxID=2768454 RepID=UPI001154AB18|nr:SpoIIE family protein phosphatase [Streptomyces sp. SLBN-118]TQK42977.1 PAS domain S-box-containing protein [Streptomyces sp. SLBN-118]